MGDYLQEEESYLQDAASPGVLSDAPATTVAVAMLFGCVIFATASLAARLWLAGLWTWRNDLDLGGSGGAAKTEGLEKSRPLDTTSLPSIYSLLYYFTVFGLILFYSYICERHPPYFHEEKTYDRDEVSLI